MQITTKEQKFKTTAEKEEIKFEVDTLNPAIMIKIVSDMYPNPRQTLLTEYVQNALDSHSEAGCPERPVEIQLPTELEPNYIVRDYGIGMTEKDITDTFRYVFRSTKNTEEDKLGGFGIGKLVFGAYSGIMYLDLFDGENVQNYLVRLKDGFAGCQEQYTAPSKEPKGVQVTVPVFTKDINYFRDVAVFQYGFLGTQPKILGEEGFFDEFNEWRTNKLLVETDDSKNRLFNCKVEYLPPFIGNHTRHALALIGGLPFKIDMGTLSQNTSTKRDQDAIDILQDRFFTLEFGPNDVDIVPSRDNLKYNMKTCRAVLHRMCELMDRVYAYIEKEMENIETLPELWETAVTFRRQGLINTAHVKKLEWDGHSGAVLAYGKLLDDMDRASGMHKAFTAPTSKVATQHSRKAYQDDPDNVDLDFVWDPSHCKVLHDIEQYLYDAVKVLRMNRRSAYSYKSINDNVVGCDDLRTALILLTLGVGDRCPLGDPKHYDDIHVFIADKDMGKGDADRRVSYELSENSYDYNPSRTMVVYLNDGYSYKDFVDYLLGLKMRIPKEVFTDISTLDKPPAGVRIARSGSNGPSDTSFADNTMFTFNISGNSPSGAFNKSFWDPASKEKMEDYAENDSVELVYVRVKSYRPQSHDSNKDTKLEIPSKRCVKPDWFEPYISTSMDFRRLLRHVKEAKTTEKTVVIIGVKPKVNMSKFPDINHLQKYCEDMYAEHLKVIPKTPPPYLNEDCIVENAVTNIFKRMHEKFSEKEDEVCKMTPKYKELNKMFGKAIKAFKPKKRNTNTERVEKIFASLEALNCVGPDTLISDHGKLVQSYTKVSQLDESLKTSLDDTTIQNLLQLSYWASPGDEQVAIPNVLMNGLYDSLNRHTTRFKNRKAFVEWADSFGKDLEPEIDLDEVFELLNKGWQDAYESPSSALPFLKEEFPDLEIKVRNCLKEVSIDQTFFTTYQNSLDKNGFNKFAVDDAGTKPGTQMYGFSVLCFLAMHLWVMSSNRDNRGSLLLRLYGDGLYGAMQSMSVIESAQRGRTDAYGWDKTSLLVYKWNTLLMLQGLEKVAAIKGIDKTTVSVIADIDRLK